MPSSVFIRGDAVSRHLEEYVRLGWHIIPTHGVVPFWPAPDHQGCACQWRKPCQPGKHPVGYWKDRPRASLTDLLRTRDEYLFSRQSEPNWAVVLGRSGVAVLDVDCHAGGPDGVGSLSLLLAEYGPLPVTPRDTRGHYLFALPECAGGWPTKIELVPGVELLTGNEGADHLLYIPPSDHWDGRRYRWLDDLAPWDVPPAYMTDWLITLAGQRLATRSAAVRTAPPPVVYRPSFSAGSYDDRLLARAAAYLSTIPGAVSEHRGHNQTFKAACKLVIDFGLSVSDALPLMLEWNRTCSPPWTEAEILHKINDAAKQPGVRGRLLDSPSRHWGEEWSDVDLEIVWPRRSWSHPRSDAPVRAHGSDGASVMGELDDLTSDAARRAARAAEAEAAAEREAARSARIAEDAVRVPPCPYCDKPILQDRMNRNHTQIVHARCHAWKCHTSCALQLKTRWQHNIRRRLSDPKLTVVYWTPALGADWVRIKQCLHRQGASQFRFTPDAGQTLAVVSTHRIGEASEELPPAEALARLTRAVRDYHGDTPPLSSSADWRLPSEVHPTAKARYIRVGKVHDLLTDDEVERFAVENGCQVDEEPSTNSNPSIQRRVRILTPPEWATSRLMWFYDCLKIGFTEGKYCEPDFDVSDFEDGSPSGNGGPGDIDLMALSP